MLSIWAQHVRVQEKCLPACLTCRSITQYAAATAVDATVGETEVKWPITVLCTTVDCVLSMSGGRGVGGINGQ